MIYKTKNGMQTGFVPGVGEIVDGKIESKVKLESANLEEVTETQTVAQPETVAPAAAPALIQPSEPVVSQPQQIQITNPQPETN